MKKTMMILLAMMLPMLMTGSGQTTSFKQR